MPGLYLTILPLLGAIAIGVVVWEFPEPALIALYSTVPMGLENILGRDPSTIVSLQKTCMIGVCAILIVKRGFSGQFNGPALAITVAAFFSGMFGSVHGKIDLSSMMRALLGSIAPFVVIWIRPRQTTRNHLILAVALGPLLSVAFGIALNIFGIHALFGVDQYGIPRLQGTTIPAFMAFLAVAAVMASFTEYALSGEARWLLLTIAAALCVLASGTRIPIVCVVLFCLIVLLFGRGPRFGVRRRGRLWLMALAGATLAALALGPALFARTFGRTGANAGLNTSGRDVLWPIYANAISRYPLFGQGIGTYRVLVDPEDVKYQGTLAAHNEYLRIGADLGVVGLTLIIVGHVIWFHTQWRFLNKIERVVVVAFGISFACYSLTDNTMIAPITPNIYLWLAMLMDRARARAEEQGRATWRGSPLSRGAVR